MNNTMSFVYSDKIMREVSSCNMKDSISYLLEGAQGSGKRYGLIKSVGDELAKLENLYESKNFQIIDMNELRKHFNKLKREWFPIGDKNTTLAVGVFWTAFMTYIFPWMLDIAKVYCAFQIAQSFYKENKGMGGKDGRTGFQSLVYFGKWYLAFWLIPWAVELIDQIGEKMNRELIENGVDLGLMIFTNIGSIF